VARALGWLVVTDPQWAGGAKGDGTHDDSAAFDALIVAMNAHTNVIGYVPAGTYKIAKAGTLTNLTAASVGLAGDPSGGSTLSFTNAAGGLSIGDGTNIIYSTVLRDLTIDGTVVANYPLQVRKSEQMLLHSVLVTNAATACVKWTDGNLLSSYHLALSNAPAGIEQNGLTGRLLLFDTDFYALTHCFKVLGTQLSRLSIDQSWLDTCVNAVTFNCASSTNAGVAEVTRSHFTNGSAPAVRAFYGNSVVSGKLVVRDCDINAASSTSPIIEFAVDNSSATLRTVVEDLDLTIAGSGPIVKPLATQTSWFNWYSEAYRINGVAESRWQPAQGVTGGTRPRPLELWGTGSPETVVAAPVGSIYQRFDGGASTCLYVKESGVGNTGWIAK
jgi:hypothetical protein